MEKKNNLFLSANQITLVLMFSHSKIVKYKVYHWHHLRTFSLNVLRYNRWNMSHHIPVNTIKWPFNKLVMYCYKHIACVIDGHLKHPMGLFLFDILQVFIRPGAATDQHQPYNKHIACLIDGHLKHRWGFSCSTSYKFS